jgi:hypothetical protein
VSKTAPTERKIFENKNVLISFKTVIRIGNYYELFILYNKYESLRF